MKRGRWPSWSLLAVALVVTGLWLWLRSANDAPGSLVSAVLITIVYLTFCAVGVLIAQKEPKNPIGWILCCIGMGAIASNFGQEYGTYALVRHPGSLPAALPIAWVANWAWYGSIGLLPFVFLLFPDGRHVSPRWRWAFWSTSFGLGTLIAGVAFAPGNLESVRVPNPLGLDWVDRIPEQIAGLGGLALLVGVLASVASLVVRGRRSSGERRQQIRWIGYAGVLMVILFFVVGPIVGIVSGYPGVGDIVFPLGLILIPLATGVAILRFHLYDINILINRSLVFGALSTGVVAFYAGTVALFDALFQRRGSGIALVATALIAVVFHPMKERLQKAVNRLMYGERDDPYAVITRLGQKLEMSVASDEILMSVAQAVAHALRLPRGG